ncbi:MAG: DinB family protein [Theionarchaea archaeon]|nr:DinB family protein [Theionarchaea archaeon]
MDQKEALLTEMKASIETLLEAAQTIKEFESTSVTGTWTAKEVLCHVAAWDLFFTDMSRNMVKGEPLPEWPDFDEFNKRAVLERRNETKEQLIEEVRETRGAYIKFIQEQPGEEIFNSRGYEFTVGSLARDIMGHDTHHLKQLKRASY